MHFHPRYASAYMRRSHLCAYFYIIYFDIFDIFYIFRILHSYIFIFFILFILLLHLHILLSNTYIPFYNIVIIILL